MPSPFTPEQLTSLSLQIDQQRELLRKEQPVPSHKGITITTSHADFQRRLKVKTRNMGARRQSLQRIEGDNHAVAKIIKQDIPDRLPVQWRAIKEITKEEPRSFWRRFKQAAHSDLCDEGGVLNAQWKKHRDLSSKSVLESFGAVLVAMGFSGNALQVLAVAAGVIVLHIGCKAVCEEE